MANDKFEDELKRVFNISEDTYNYNLFPELTEFISKEDFENLVERNNDFKDKKSYNISNKTSEGQKVIRLKEKSAEALTEMYEVLLAKGIKIPINIIADYFLLKGMNKI